jgi:hypothetical protein
MIRQANKYDKQDITDMMLQFHAEADMPELPKNTDHLSVVLDNIFAGQGVVFIEEGKGLIMALIIPTIWCDKTFAMHELAWYVKPQERNTTVGYRLFISYINYAKKLVEEKRIKYFTMTKLDVSPDLKYEKYGFRKKDENWIQ